MPGTHITRFSLELSGKITILLTLHLCENIVRVTIRCNEWSIHNFLNVVIIKFSFFLPFQVVLEFPIPLNIRVVSASSPHPVLVQDFPQVRQVLRYSLALFASRSRRRHRVRNCRCMRLSQFGQSITEYNLKYCIVCSACAFASFVPSG